MSAPLPFVEGVGPSCQWLPAGPWKTVIDFFKDQYPHVDATTWNERMAKGQVMDENGRRVDSKTAFRVGACIFYYRELENEKTIPFVEQVLYQDDHILVADKPHFLPVIPSGKFLHETLLVRLRKQRATEALVPIHRLDRETAGVVLFSLNPKTRGHYTSLFRNRQVRKVYEALAPTLEDSELPHYSAKSHRAGRTVLSHERSSGRSKLGDPHQVLQKSGTPHSVSVASTHRQETPASSPPRGLRNSDHQ